MAMMKTSNQPTTMTFDAGKIPSSDPLAYQQGFLHGYTLGANDKYDPADFSEKAQAFQEGYKLGRSVKLGEAEPPVWFKS
jgi:hypothetical protein